MSDGHFCFVSPIHYSLLLFPIPSAAGPHADRPTITQANKAPLTQLCFVRPEYSTLIFQHFSISPSLAVYKHIVYPFSKQAADIRNIYSCWHYIYKHMVNVEWMSTSDRQKSRSARFLCSRPAYRFDICTVCLVDTCVLFICTIVLTTGKYFTLK